MTFQNFLTKPLLKTYHYHLITKVHDFWLGFLLLLVTCCAQLCRLTFVWRISTIHVPKFFYCWLFFPGITFCCYKNYRDIGEFVPKFWPNNCLHFVERGQIRCRITKDNYIRFWVSVGPWNRRKGA